MPYCLYMVLMIFLASKGAGEYLDLLESEHDHEKKDKKDLIFLEGTKDKAKDAPKVSEEAEEEDHSMPWIERLVIICTSLVVGVLWAYFFTIELKQIRENVKIYFSDVWNVFDFSSLVLNALLIIMINLTIMADSIIWEPYTMRTIGSIAVWFLWIKTFYWMRLF